MKRSLALILHAHLPFVRDSEGEGCAEERWLFEAITESYVPALQMLQRLGREETPFRITLTFSPTLASMLRDPMLIGRYRAHLDSLIALSEKQIERNRANPPVHSLAQFHRDLFAERRRIFVEDWSSDLLHPVRQLHRESRVELIATAATHGILPLLQSFAGAARAQVAIGCDFVRDVFAAEPVGFWLPECAYASGVDELLREHNIRWFVVDQEGLAAASPAPRRGVFAPCFTPAGPAVFARHRETSLCIWSAQTGYPGDEVYRDFYRDIGFDLNAEELEPLAHGQFTGIKYWRVTGKNGLKGFYDPALAARRAEEHAQHFLAECSSALAQANACNDALLVVPFDAELFGHWWFEGPRFLEHVIRGASQHDLHLVTPTDYLRDNPTLQIVEPASSSWGDGGLLDVWLDEKCSWIYPQLQAASARILGLAKNLIPSPENNRAINQLTREFLLASASDWPFHMRNQTAADFAAARIRDHLARFDRLASSLERGAIDSEFLHECEARDNLFPAINWRHCIPGP